MPISRDVSEIIISVNAVRLPVFIGYHGYYAFNEFRVHKSRKNVLGVCKSVVLGITDVEFGGSAKLAVYSVAVAGIIRTCFNRSKPRFFNCVLKSLSIRI